MNLPIFKRKAVERLWHIASNQPKSYGGREFRPDGDSIKDDELLEVPGVTFDPNLFQHLVFPGPEKSIGASDSENALILFQELRGMTPKVARDERVWCALSHLYGKDFIWRRHIEGTADEKLSRTLQTRYFCRANGRDRGFERDNALSRLWWWAFMSSKVESLTHAQALETLLESTDFRDAVVGRPTTSIIPQVFEALLLIYRREKEADPSVAFFSRKSRDEGEGNYRELLVLINRHGGRTLYDTMEVEELADLFWSLRKTIKENEVDP
jgi:hypothetical protein